MLYMMQYPLEWVLDVPNFRMMDGALDRTDVAAGDADISVFVVRLGCVQVVSWDEGKGTVDEDVDDGRSYISVISEVIVDEDEDCDGAAKKTMGEARMDIVNSEMAYLGHYDSESYGLTWKVRGDGTAGAFRVLPPLPESHRVAASIVPACSGV